MLHFYKFGGTREKNLKIDAAETETCRPSVPSSASGSKNSESVSHDAHQYYLSLDPRRLVNSHSFHTPQFVTKAFYKKKTKTKTLCNCFPRRSRTSHD